MWAITHLKYGDTSKASQNTRPGQQSKLCLQYKCRLLPCLAWQKSSRCRYVWSWQYSEKETDIKQLHSKVFTGLECLGIKNWTEGRSQALHSVPRHVPLLLIDEVKEEFRWRIWESELAKVVHRSWLAWLKKLCRLRVELKHLKQSACKDTFFLQATKLWSSLQEKVILTTLDVTWILVDLNIISQGYCVHNAFLGVFRISSVSGNGKFCYEKKQHVTQMKSLTPQLTQIASSANKEKKF